MKKFFSIEEKKYVFEWCDVITLLTITNVCLIIMGWHWAPLIALVNCALSIVLNVRNHAHINTYAMQIALIVLNFYFLRG